VGVFRHFSRVENACDLDLASLAIFPFRFFETVHPLATLSIGTQNCQVFPGARQCRAIALHKKPAPVEVCDFFFDRSAAAMETSFTVHD
jgi:hypothetical protein